MPARAQDSPEPVTAIVCTRNRGSMVVGAVESLLASDLGNVEVIVVDQSTDEETAKAVEKFRADSRFRFVRSDRPGVSRGRNQALEMASSEICCLTDDDCVAHPGWMRSVEELFQRLPKVAMAFYGVEAGEHDARAG